MIKKTGKSFNKLVQKENNRNIETLTDLTKFLKIIAEPNRLMILSILQNGELSVGQLQEKLNLPLNLVSFHLRPLKNFNLLQARKQGLSIFYSLNESKICSYRHELNMFLCEKCAVEGMDSC
jgi:DNA-binding transcriptional ArsR family regulator